MLLVALIFGGAVLLAVSAWHMRRGHHAELFRSTAKLGLFVLTVATVLQFPSAAGWASTRRITSR